MKNEFIDKRKRIKEIGKVDYISKKQFKKMYPMENVGYSLVGFIGDGIAEPIGNWKYHDEIRDYYSFKKKRYFYEIIGYLEVEENIYIAIMQRKVLKRILPFLLMLIMIGLLIFNILAPKGPELEDGMDQYTPTSSIQKNTDSTSILLPGYKDLNMEENTDTAYVALYNPEGNPCYFKFKITLDETGQIIYESKLIPPGYAVTAVKFDRSFPTGIYPISINIETFSLDDYKEKMNGGDIKTRIVSIEK
ncbi:hypothetical protein ACWG0P_05615 [Amedibacillus sp. YH-ame6]